MHSIPFYCCISWYSMEKLICWGRSGSTTLSCSRVLIECSISSISFNPLRLLPIAWLDMEILLERFPLHLWVTHFFCFFENSYWKLAISYSALFLRPRFYFEPKGMLWLSVPELLYFLKFKLVGLFSSLSLSDMSSSSSYYASMNLDFPVFFFFLISWPPMKGTD